MKYLIPFVAIVLVGCTEPTKTEIAVSAIESIKIERPPAPRPIDVRPFKWEVIIQDGTAYYALTSDGYENLSLTIADIKRYLEDQKSVIEFYENSIDRIDLSVKERNDELSGRKSGKE